MPIRELLLEDHLLQQPDIVRALFNAAALLKTVGMFYLDLLTRVMHGLPMKITSLKKRSLTVLKYRSSLKIISALPALSDQDLKNSDSSLITILPEQ
ncbi:MAG: hypothetical protein WDO19_21910 [Bacteroidota bacterium]